MKKYLFFLMAVVALAFTACEKPGGGETGGGTGTGEGIDANTVLTLNPTQVSITPGEQKRISVSLNPQPSGTFNITWSTSDASVATVAGAVITGVSTGEATITAKIDGTNISASVAVKVGTAIDNAEFSTIKVVGYQADMITLSVETYEIAENGDTIWKTISDINEDGTDDYFIKAVAYIMPPTMTYEGGTGVVGTPGYVISASTSIIFDGTYIYPFWNYTFSDDEEKYLTTQTNEKGQRCMKWRYATYTHFNAENYCKRLFKMITTQGAWPSSQEEYDAWMAANPYMGNHDSYLGYLMVPDDQAAYISVAGLVTGGKGFTCSADDQNNIILPYLDVDLKFFTNHEYYGLALRTDGDTQYFVTEGEGEAMNFVMADMVDRKISFDNRKSAQKRANNQFKGIPMKRLEADRLTNVALMQVLPRF